MDGGTPEEIAVTAGARLPRGHGREARSAPVGYQEWGSPTDREVGERVAAARSAVATT